MYQLRKLCKITPQLTSQQLFKKSHPLSPPQISTSSSSSSPQLLCCSQMPHLVDLDSLVRVGDSKVACESTLTGSLPEPDPDLPAESFRISVSDLDWVSINNHQLDRDDSTKGTTNPKSHLHHHNQPVAGPTTSQRFSGNLLKVTAKAPIIGLPNKIQHSGYLGHSARRAQVIRIFPKKGGVNVSDPGSPKVSCFGKVASQRERRRSPESGGCWASLFGCFRRPKEEEEEATAVKNERNFPARERTTGVTPVAEPPGLGGMKRLVSGRRPASWGGDVGVDLEGEEIGQVAWSGPLDRR